MAFTTGTLLLNESITVAELYRMQGDRDKVRTIAIEDNRLQMRTTQCIQADLSRGHLSLTALDR